MRPVAIVGIGKTAFGAFPDRTLRSLAVEAGEKCMQDAGVSPSQIEAFYLGNFAGPSFVGPESSGSHCREEAWDSQEYHVLDLKLPAPRAARHSSTRSLV